MKKDIHPNYNKSAKITCACGNVIEVGSTASDMKVDICANCHPFYTGKEKLIDKAGRVERFQARIKKASTSTKKTPGRTGKKGK